VPYQPTGVGAFGLSVNWEKVPGDKEVARRVITYLENRRTLFATAYREDPLYCVESATQIRNFLTEELSHARPGKSLAKSVRAMRSALMAFVDALGPDARSFMQQRGWLVPFDQALDKLRSRVGLQLALIADQYDLDVDDDLAQILPSLGDDISFLPGFNRS